MRYLLNFDNDEGKPKLELRADPKGHWHSVIGENTPTLFDYEFGL
jgi:hypothetical protein